jgi:hypothetical protein
MTLCRYKGCCLIDEHVYVLKLNVFTKSYSVEFSKSFPKVSATMLGHRQTGEEI